MSLSSKLLCVPTMLVMFVSAVWWQPEKATVERPSKVVYYFYKILSFLICFYSCALISPFQPSNTFLSGKMEEVKVGMQMSPGLVIIILQWSQVDLKKAKTSRPSLSWSISRFLFIHTLLHTHNILAEIFIYKSITFNKEYFVNFYVVPNKRNYIKILKYSFYL